MHIQHDDTQHNNKNSTFSIMTLSITINNATIIIITLSITIKNATFSMMTLGVMILDIVVLSVA
jgi:hypothetical protein